MNAANLYLARAALPLVLFVPALFGTVAQAAPGTFDLSTPANGAWCTATCTFRWQAAASAASYDLYVDDTLKHAAVTGTTYTLTSGEAMPDGWRTWYVVAKDSGGATTPSASTFSVRVDASPPTVPGLTSPAADAWVGSASPTFAWTASSDAGSGLSGYEVWLNGAAAMTGIPATTISITVSLPSVSVYYKTFAMASECPGDWQISGTGGGWYCSISSVNHLTFPVVAMGTPDETATMPGVMDLANAGHADLTIYEGKRSTTALFEIQASYDGGTSWGTVKLLPSSAQLQYSTDVFSLDDFTGTASAKLRLHARASQPEVWVIDWLSVKAVPGGVYSWQVVAVDAAGNRTPSETRQLRYDLPPARFDLSAPANGTWTANTVPTLSWTATTDAGSGLAGYQLWIDDALSADGISPSATSAAPASALADGMHKWQVYAVDAAGAVRKSNQAWQMGVDTTAPTAFSLLSPADQSASSIPTPNLCWNAAADSGSGVDHYQLFLNGALDRDSVTATCTTPSTALAEGGHTWSASAVDKVGNVHPSTETWTIYIDFGAPTGFALVSPADGATVDTLTPAFTWQASSDTGSGIAHYELYVDDACVACSIDASTTSTTLTTALSAGPHTWSVKAVDRSGQSATATGAPWSFTARACAPGTTTACPGNSTGACDPGTQTCNADGTLGACMGVVGPVAEVCADGIDNDCDGATDCDDPDCAAICSVGPEPRSEPGPESAPEPGPEIAPELPRDAGVDAPSDSRPDGPTSTATSTSTTTATNTSTGTVTSTGTATSTTTTTSVGAEPRPDGGMVVGTDAPAVIADAAIPRDGARTDVAPSSTDGPFVPPTADGATSPGVLDGGLVLADAGVSNAPDARPVRSDGGPAAALDGAGYDGRGTGEADSSGCGCAVGGGGGGHGFGVWMLALGLLLLRLASRPGRRARRPS